MAAAALHLGLPLLALVAPPPRAEPPREEAALEVVEIDLSPPPTPASPDEAAPAERAAAREPAPRTASAVPARAGEAAPAIEAPRAETAEPTPTTAPPTPAAPTTGGYDAPPTDGREVLFAPGIGGPAVWSLPGVVPGAGSGPAPAPTAPAATRAPDRDVAGQVLRGTLRGKDKALGLDLPAAGSVASALADAVRATDAPGNARASFEIRIDARGKVVSVRVLSMSAGARQSWERVAREAASRLAGRELAMTGAFAAGASVFVDITSALQLPAGSGGALAEGPPPGTVGGGMTFDLSNLGAHATRVVKSSFRAVPVAPRPAPAPDASR